MTEAVTSGSRTPGLRIALVALPGNVAVVRQAVAAMAAELGAEPGLVDDIKTAVSEAATNVVVHAYPDDDTGPLEVFATATPEGRLEVAVRDRGIGMQPRPMPADASSLRIGLALIGALANGVQIHGEYGKGTEIRMSFDLDGSEEGAWSPQYDPADVTEGRTVLTVNNIGAGGAALTNMLAMLAARSDLDLDRLADAQMIGDFLNHWIAGHADGLPLEISVRESPGSLAIRIGPLKPGSGNEFLETGNLPGIGNTLKQLANKAAVVQEETSGGPADFLELEIGIAD